MVTEDEAMRRAIALAARGLGTTSPNPVVGCLLPLSRAYAFWRVPNEARLSPARLAIAGVSR